MSLFNQTKFNRNSKLVRKAALAKALLDEANNAKFKIPCKVSDHFTPQKREAKNKPSSLTKNPKIQLIPLNLQQDASLFRCLEQQPKSSTPSHKHLRIKTSLPPEDISPITSPSQYHTTRQHRAHNQSDSKGLLFQDKRSIVLTRDQPSKGGIARSLRQRSAASVQLEDSLEKDLSKRKNFYMKKQSTDHNEYGQFEIYKSSGSRRKSENKNTLQENKKRVMVANIDLSKFAFSRKESESNHKQTTISEDGQSHYIVTQTDYEVLKERNITQQLNIQTEEDSQKTEMRKSRQVYRTNFNMSYGHPQKDYRDEATKENLIMPQTIVVVGDDKERISTSRVRQVERILSDKQRDYNRIFTENQNLMAEVRSLNTRLSSLQENYSRMESVAGFSHKTIQDLRDQARKLREQLNICKSNSMRQGQQKEKEFRIQFDKLLNQKNQTITRLQVFLRQTQKQLEALRKNTDNYAKTAKLDELEKLVEYYRKENKIIGMQLFNTKKNYDQLSKLKEIGDKDLKQAIQKIQSLNNSVAYKDQQLLDKDNYQNEKLKHCQHQKNLLYESLSKNMSIKEQEINSLKRQITRLRDEPSLVRSYSALEISRPRITSSQDLKIQANLMKQLEQSKSELSKTTALLTKQTSQKEKAIAQKKILLNALIEKQKRQEEQKRQEIAQRQSCLNAKFEELENISTQLNCKSSQINHLNSVIKGLQGKLMKTETLLEDTNKELLKARLEGLAKKMNQYY